MLLIASSRWPVYRTNAVGTVNRSPEHVKAGSRCGDGRLCRVVYQVGQLNLMICMQASEAPSRSSSEGPVNVGVKRGTHIYIIHVSMQRAEM
jgi:hypothetical protein